MIQLQVLSGRQSGRKFDGNKFPVVVGRAEQSDVVLDDAGVWPSHCKIHWRADGLFLEVEPNALASVNGAPTPHTILRNGDTITLGGVTLRFSLGAIRQGSLMWREWLTWIALGALCVGQVAAIYWLSR